MAAGDHQTVAAAVVGSCGRWERCGRGAWRRLCGGCRRARPDQPRGRRLPPRRVTPARRGCSTSSWTPPAAACPTTDLTPHFNPITVDFSGRASGVPRWIRISGRARRTPWVPHRAPSSRPPAARRCRRSGGRTRARRRRPSAQARRPFCRLLSSILSLTPDASDLFLTDGNSTRSWQRLVQPDLRRLPRRAR